MKFKRNNPHNNGNENSQAYPQYGPQHYPGSDSQNQNNGNYGYQNQQPQYENYAPHNQPPQLYRPDSAVSIPNQNFGPAAIKIIRKEFLYHLILFIIFFAIFAMAGGAAVIFFLFSNGYIGSNIIVEYFETNVIGWYVLMGIIGFPSFVGWIWNLIQLRSWKSTAKKLKLNNRYDDASVSFKFGDVYKKQVLRNVSVKWLVVSTITYYGIFTALIFAFKDVVIDIDTTNIKFFLDIGEGLRNAFGDIVVFSSVNVAILVGIIILSVLYVVFNKKYILQLRDFLGVNAQNTVESVEQRRISKNKAFRRIYILSVLITIVLPLFIIGFLIWKFGKRKRSK